MSELLNSFTARWNHLVELLRLQTLNAATPKTAVESTRNRIRAFIDDAQIQSIYLPKPDFIDPAFGGKVTWSSTDIAETLEHGIEDLGTMGDTGERPEEYLPPPEIANLSALSFETIPLPITRNQGATNQLQTQLKRQLVASRQRSKELERGLKKLERREKIQIRCAKEGKMYRPGSKKRLTPHLCWCGCGLYVKPSSIERRPNGRLRVTRFHKFLSGHLRKYEGWVTKMERGDLTFDQLPGPLKNRLRHILVRCIGCHGLIPNCDPMGRRLPEYYGLDCWRTRRHVSWPYRTISSRKEV